MRLTEVLRFPVKSCRGESLDTAVVEPWGLEGDRRWMLVDETGETATARDHRRMLLIHPRITGTGLTVTAPDLPPLRVERPDRGPHVDVSVFGRTPFAAALAGAEAHAWFTRALGDVPVRLVYADDPRRRNANPDFAGPDVPMAFEDGYPLNLGHEASLAALNELIADGPRAAEGDLPMVRFRPNLVIAGGTAWEEDGWRRLRVGEATFRVVKGCDRCAIPTTHPDTAVRYQEPTATLARHRRWDGAVWFGMQLVAETPGATVRVGDEVEVLEAVASDGPPR